MASVLRRNGTMCFVCTHLFSSPLQFLQTLASRTHPKLSSANHNNHSALMTLHSSLSSSHTTSHTPLPPTQTQSESEIETTLSYTLTRMSQFAHSFNTIVGWVDPEGISPFAPLGVAIAAKMM